MRIAELWTMARAIRTGVIAGTAALLLWPMHVIFGRPIRPAFVAALLLTLAAGVSILITGLIDLATVDRDRRVLPARLFDLAFGLVLAAPSGLALADLLVWNPLE